MNSLVRGIRRFSAAPIIFLALALGSTAALATPKPFNIDRQEAPRSLLEFGRQSALQILFASEKVKGVITNAVHGNYEPIDALNLLLKGTPLVASEKADGVLVVEPIRAHDTSNAIPAAAGDSGGSTRLVQATNSSSASSQISHGSDQKSSSSVAKATDDNKSNLEEIVVTGSHLAHAYEESAAPVDTLSSAEIVNSGLTNIGDAISQMPQASPMHNTTGSVHNGIPGLNQLDLRNLGPNRTLVLVDGHRHIAFGSGGAVDVSSIPTDFIERVEITTGGASAVYGADAIAGVINFIEKRHFEGIEGRFQSGMNQDGRADNQFASVTAGSNFAQDRGNVMANLEFNKIQGLTLSQTDHSHDAFLVDNPAYGVNGNFSVPQKLYITNTRLGLSDAGGLLLLGPHVTFDKNGASQPFNPGSASYDGGAFNVGGSGLPFYDAYDPVYPDQKRAGGVIKANYDLSSAMTVYGEAKANRVESHTTGLPDRLGLLTGQPSGLFQVTTSNPFMPADVKADPLVSALGYALMSRMNTEFTNDFVPRYDTQRYDIGVKGDFGRGWSYDLSAVYGQVDGGFGVRNLIHQDRFSRAVDVVTDTAGVLGKVGAPVCRATLANAMLVSPSTDRAITGCVPADVFGPGNISPAAVGYISETGEEYTHRAQSVLSFVSSGNLGEAVALPGGAINVALGAEYRNESMRSSSDASFLLWQSNFMPIKGSFHTSEEFAEVSVPIVKDLRFARELTIDAAVRFADYNTVGRTTSWKTGFNWAPVESVHLRGTLATAVRAPDIASLFQARIATQGANDFDPCDTDFISQNPNRAANCAAVGVPRGYHQGASTAIYTLLTGGNPNLKQEASHTWTAGIVFAPTSTLELSADYYSISISQVIENYTPSQILSGCVDGSAPSAGFCSRIARNSMGGLVTVDTSTANAAKLETSGLDLDAVYRQPLASWGTLNLRLRGSWLNHYITTLLPGDPLSADESRGGAGFPATRIMFDTGWSRNGLSADYVAHFTARVLNGDRSLFVNNPNAIEPKYLGSFVVQDLRVGYDLSTHVNVYGGINNIFNVAPPIAVAAGSLQIGYYDEIGRFLYAGGQIKF